MTSAAMPKRKCKFTDELKKKYPCFRLGRDASEAECMTCRAGTYVSVANKGGSDLEAHVHSAKHKTAARGESSSSKVTDFFVSKTDTSVTAAEGTLAFHTIKHHNSYRSMDCTSGLLRKIFPDSVTAQKSAEGDSVHPVGYNFKHMTCKDFHTYLIGNRRLMGNSEKYAQPHEED